jgi:hypothetical protein
VPPEAGNDAAREDDPPQGVQLYNSRGHPSNPWSRAQSRRSIEAMNDVLSVVGVVQRNLPEALEEFGDHLVYGSKMANDEESVIGERIGWSAEIANQFMSWWIHAFTNRLLVFTISRTS